MAAIMMRKLFVVLVFLVVLVSGDVSKRTVKITPWPDCDKNSYCDEAKKEGINVVYGKASSAKGVKSGEYDNLYYAFSTKTLPTILLVRATTSNADIDMKFDWEKIYNGTSLDDAIGFSDSDKVKILYKFGVAFTRLIEFDDKDDSADMKHCEKKLSPDEWKIRDFGDFTWKAVDKLGQHDSFVFNTTTDMVPPEETHNGSLSFTFTVKGADGRSSDLPALKFGANETLFDFLMANYTPSFNHSRFALEAVLVSLSTDSMSFDKTNSIDDEYAPGVFEIVSWLSNTKRQSTSGFFQWKPVSYLSKTRGRSTATRVTHYDLLEVDKLSNQTEPVNSSMIRALFGNSLWDEKQVIVRATNISFGLPKDGFYLKNNYTAWTAAIGYGTPPEDKISTTVIIIISAGLGLPVVIIIFGGIYTCIRKAKRGGEYSAINNGTVSRNEPMVN